MRMEKYLIPINYNQSFKDMVEAGDYKWVNRGITEKNFPINIKGKVTGKILLILVHFNRCMCSDQVLKKFAEHQLQLQPGILLGLLVFGAEHPDKQREFPIVAIGSVWKNQVPYIGQSSSKNIRGLSLNSRDRKWGKRYRFLATKLVDI